MDEVTSQPPVSAPPQESFFRRISPIAFVLMALTIVFVLYQILAGVITILLLGKIDSPEVAVWMRVATAGGQILCILVPTILLARARYGRIVEPLRLRLPSPLDILVVAIALVALQQVLQGYMLAQDAIPLPPQIQRYVKMFKEMMEATYRMLVTAGSPVEFAGVVFTVAFVPAIVEELLFRGLVQRDLEKLGGGIRAAVIAGVLFGAYHLNPFSVVPLVALGIFFGFVVYRTQNITLAMIAHFLNNFMACCTLYYGLSEDYLVIAPVGPASPQMVWVNTGVCTLVFVAAVYYFIRTTSHDQIA
jgi:uncharacterized protein